VRATVSDDGDGDVRDWLNGAALLEWVKMLGCLGKDKKKNIIIISWTLIFKPVAQSRLRR